MPDDIVADFGYLTLGTRLKRLGDRLQTDVQRAIGEENLPVTVAQYPLLAALDLHGGLTIGELVKAIGISQPGVTRMLSNLQDSGLVTLDTDPADKRSKRASLTGKGRNLIAVSRAGIWPVIEAAVEQACTDDIMAPDILKAIGLVERALDERSLFNRMQLIARERSGARK